MSYSKDYYQAHKEEIITANRNRRHANPIHYRNYKRLQGDLHPEYYRTTNMQYQLDHPSVHLKNNEIYNRKPEVIARRKIVKESLKMVRAGLIPTTPCSCGCNEDLRLFHTDYDSPYHVEFKCKECFWAATKARYRERNP